MSAPEEIAEQQREDELRGQVEARPERAADAVSETIGLAVAEALARGEFVEQLAERGWVLVHVGVGSCPEPPKEWLHDGIDITAQGWLDPIGRLHELWQTAWEAGRRAGSDARELVERVREVETFLEQRDDLVAELRRQLKAAWRGQARAQHAAGLRHDKDYCEYCKTETVVTLR
ncbi:hypothetical protein BBK82_03565 [Lentzea guizhouensis]|uniref:Uncharacterized protein n=1 Tax=Lentzea guizhouensis TaxID=1586287 RepID=A0A1B2HC49_9PSEU|nr:hypothetical protein [Lentzea guizhouensis]ANZ35294.1 hypothetical protein BBK82_03565 [Lentzea guizhouensis]